MGAPVKTEQVILDLMEAGCPPEVIAAFLRKQEARREEEQLAFTEKKRLQKQKERNAKRNENNDRVADVAGDTGDIGDIYEDTAPISRENITTRAPAVIPVGLLRNPPNEIKKTNKKAAAPTGAESDLFKRFWAAFPNSNGKAKALENFIKAVRSGADPEAIIAGAERYAAEKRGSDPRYIKHAQGWLTDRRWEDEPAQRGPPQDKPKSGFQFSTTGNTCRF